MVGNQRDIGGGTTVYESGFNRGAKVAVETTSAGLKVTVDLSNTSQLLLSTRAI